MFRHQKTLTLILGLLALACLASCSVGPDYKQPATPAPAAYKSATLAEAQNAAAAPPVSSTWWTLFDDPTLTRLVDEALAANPTIQAAMASVDQARAVLKSERAGYYPSLGLSPAASRALTHTSNNTGQVLDFTTNNFTLPLDLSYEVDIWGKVRRAAESAKASALASAADYEVIRQTMLSDLAQDYFLLNLYDEQTAILLDSVASYQYQVDITKTEQRAGLAAQTDVLLAQTQVDTTEQQLTEARRNRATTEHAIALLLGKTPDQLDLPPPPASRGAPSGSAVAATGTSAIAATGTNSINATGTNAVNTTGTSAVSASGTSAAPIPSAFIATVPVIPAGLPSTLLIRRPDVAEAEQTLIAANAQIGVAVAQLYPSLNLSGALGFENNTLTDPGLLSWSNRIWSIAGGISAPLFEGGALRAGVEEARAVYRGQLANYRTAVLTAFGDVEDALTNMHYFADEARMLGQTVHDASEDMRLTQLEYRQGLASMLTLITTDQSLLTARLNAAQVTQQRLATAVLLFRALGGGWNPDDMNALLKSQPAPAK